MVSPVASRGSTCVSRLGPVDHDALRAYAVVGAENRPERRRRLAQFERGPHLFLRREAEAAIGFGNGQAEETELAHLGEDVAWDAIVFREPLLVRHEPLAHEAGDRLPDLVQGGWVANHYLPRSVGRRPAHPQGAAAGRAPAASRTPTMRSRRSRLQDRRALFSLLRDRVRFRPNLRQHWAAIDPKRRLPIIALSADRGRPQ